jgi:hypothetical protein
MHRLLMVIACALVLSGCVAGYTLIEPKVVPVAKGSMKVTPSIAWNRSPKNIYDIAKEENWTQNGPLLDTITFMGGLKDGEAIARQRAKDERQVPVFRSNMTPQDLVSMVESYYRIKAGATIFETTGLAPAKFLGKQAVEFNFTYVGGDEVKRRGRSLLAVVDSKLYLIALEGTSVHYFDAALPEFQKIVESAEMG